MRKPANAIFPTLNTRLQHDGHQSTCGCRNDAKAARYLRSLNERETQHILAECVLDFSVHVLAQGGEVHTDILRGGGVFADLEDNFLRLVVADGKLQEIDAKRVRRQRTQKSCPTHQSEKHHIHTLQCGIRWFPRETADCLPSVGFVKEVTSAGVTKDIFSRFGGQNLSPAERIPNWSNCDPIAKKMIMLSLIQSLTD